MRIVHLSSELASIVKVGGLGDVVFGLSKAQAKMGHQVEVVLPFYEGMDTSALTQWHLLDERLYFPFDSRTLPFRVWSGQLGQVQVRCLELMEDHSELGHPTVYGTDHDPIRFLAFCGQCLAWLQATKDSYPEIVHLHDWPTAAFTALAHQKDAFPATLLTLHNVYHQGLLYPGLLERAGLYGYSVSSLLELGLLHAGGISAVSKTYLQEIQTPLGGSGLDALLRDRISHLPSEGIINGIDEEYWNPSRPELPCPYESANLHFIPHRAECEEKLLNKQALRSYLNLSHPTAPLVACITRLVPQKGLDLIEEALHRTCEQGGQFVLLGQSPIPEVERHFQALDHRLRGTGQVAIELTYTETLARLLFASADLILIPSLFEPCGLTQLIGFRYGALALARETGGLKDTVIDLDHHCPDKGTGFTFCHCDKQGVISALDRALFAWYERGQEWQLWVKRVMNQPLGWETPTKHYLSLYQQILGRELSMRNAKDSARALS